MPRYIVERIFPAGHQGLAVRDAVIRSDTDAGVTWVHSYVSDDRERTFCLYDAPNPEAIRRAAERNSLPVERITRVSVLEPYFYAPSARPPLIGPSPDEGGAGIADRPTHRSRAKRPTERSNRMAKFMDVHSGFIGVTGDQLREAHDRDLAIEKDEGVHFERAWLDSDSGKVFCLATGPSKESVMRIHERAGHPTAEVYEINVEVI